MKRALLFACLLSLTARGAMPAGFAERMADAVYQAEGGNHTRYPYGVMSVKVANATEARAVTIRSIHNNWRRWEQSGRPGQFIDFMADRWCPVAADRQGNINWKRNVKGLLR